MSRVNGGVRQARTLIGRQQRLVAAALDNGVSAVELARAYGVSVRTVFRARERAREQWTEVVVGDWRAQFVLTDEGPVRVTPWWAA